MKLLIYSYREFDEGPMFRALAQEYGFKYATCPARPSVENAHLAKGCDAIITTLCDFNAAVVNAFADVGIRYIATRTVGYEHIDLAAAKARGMRVSRVDYPPNAVANYTVMLVLMAQRRIQQTFDRAMIQNYALHQDLLGDDIEESTIGIIGTGKIGALTARLLSGFGCKVLCYARRENPELKDVCTYVDMETLLKESDVVSLHVPSTAENIHMVNAQMFSKMKDGAILVNTARGNLVDTDAMVCALESGKLSGVALDVIEGESELYYQDCVGKYIPNPNLAILRTMPNALLTPHLAFYSKRALRHIDGGAIACIYDMVNGRENPWIVL